MHTLRFTLKQHTPIVHFQHDQDAATLRATELKPKLDSFIIRKYQLTEIVNEQTKKTISVNPLFKNYFIGEGGKSLALNYKIRITAENEIPDLCTEIEQDYISNTGRHIPEKFPGFFGLLGDQNKGTKKFVMHDTIIIEIHCFIEDLRDKIRDNIAEFFMKHNFGMRQSKGFGSFYITQNDPLYKSHELNEIRLPYWFDLTLTTGSKNMKSKRPEIFRAQFELFENISLFYSTLRNGINLHKGKNNPVLYIKSFLFLYAKSINIQWEKRKIKQAFFLQELKKQEYDHPGSDILTYESQNPYLMRDIFGLASNSDWKFPYNDIINKTSGTVERYQSPILFKPIKTGVNIFRVYFDAVNENYGIYNQPFVISTKYKRNKFSIKTPPQFDFRDFFRYAFTRDLESIAVFDEENPPRELTILNNLFSQVKRNAGF